MKRVVGVVLLLIACAYPCSKFAWDDDPIFYLTGKVVNSYYQPETWNERRAWLLQGAAAGWVGNPCLLRLRR